MMTEENERIPMDTISISDRLQGAGMGEPAANAVAKELMRASDPPATKSDIDRLERAIEELGRIISRRH